MESRISQSLGQETPYLKASHDRCSADLAEKLGALRLQPALLPSLELIFHQLVLDVVKLGGKVHKMMLVNQAVQSLAAVDHEGR